MFLWLIGDSYRGRIDIPIFGWLGGMNQQGDDQYDTMKLTISWSKIGLSGDSWDILPARTVQA